MPSKVVKFFVTLVGVKYLCTYNKNKNQSNGDRKVHFQVFLLTSFALPLTSLYFPFTLIPFTFLTCIKKKSAKNVTLKLMDGPFSRSEPYEWPFFAFWSLWMALLRARFSDNWPQIVPKSFIPPLLWHWFSLE